jgi:hypothetical protein
LGRARPRCPGCGHLPERHTVANSRYALWGIGCTVEKCGCPENDSTTPAQPDYVVKQWALLQIRQQARTVHRAIAAAEGMVAAGEVDRRSAAELRRGYVAGVDLISGLEHLADTGLLVEAFDTRMLGIDAALLDVPRRRLPAG